MKTVAAAAAALVLAATTGASAADLAPRYTKAPPAAVWSWTGFYIGAHVGAGWGTTETSLASTSPLVGPPFVPGMAIAQNDRSGFLGGGQIGYNYQSGWAVFGIQGDIAGLGVKGTAPCIQLLSCTAKSDWLGTVSGRLGGVVADRTLVYVKGGAAWLHTDHTLTVPAGFAGPSTLSVGSSTTALGWLLGLGAEYAFSPNWSAFIEYNYIDFDKKTMALDLSALGAPLTANVDVKNKLSIAKVGVNYKF